eukprot:CAMPEP_0185593184 /NCGR_PEP_ID=MMETSP0434-20130131/70687_1 /TAXON_ID=626734 ORGANISM="Favella taraikaensis, Strain Fe Narragansett Bay" /NCGR_SAMPLE_ID=MMETSP0434 /ASSEMBLY_ACC=CAM_ASM_000379 /LENGTH=65 /DNA_ID=CAMNT_0028219601 /DNA_START=154 /DNA_END=351 /DNA_ORIENTATION=-
MREKCSELGIFQLLGPRAFSPQPLCEKLQALKGKIEIAFLWGDNDWVARERPAADKMIEEGQIDG